MVFPTDLAWAFIPCGVKAGLQKSVHPRSFKPLVALHCLARSHVGQIAFLPPDAMEQKGSVFRDVAILVSSGVRPFSRIFEKPGTSDSEKSDPSDPDSSAALYSGRRFPSHVSISLSMMRPLSSALSVCCLSA